MGITEAVKKGFTLSGKLFKVIALFFILNLVMGLVSLPLAKPENIGNPSVAVISFILSLLFFLIFIYLQGGALGAARDVHKSGSWDMSNFSVYGKKYYMRILGLLALYTLVALAIVLILALIGSGVLSISDNAFTRTLVFGVAAIIALFTVILLLLPIYSIVADEKSVMQALKKGVKLGKEHFWPLLGLFTLLIVISIFISLTAGFAIGLATVPLPLLPGQVLITIVNSAVQSYIPIVMMLALMGYYLSLSREPETPQA